MLIKIKQCELILIFDFNFGLENWNLEFGICFRGQDANQGQFSGTNFI